MKKLTGSFRHSHWDPWLIIFQILAVQFILYSSLWLIIFIFSGLFSLPQSLDLIFEYHEINVIHMNGFFVLSAFLLNALVGAVTLWYIVERTKLCLDFSCTWYSVHLLICWFYNSSFPTTFSWWTLNIICATIMCVCGEFLCLRTELKAIPLTLTARSDV